ncbi:conserved domain protein [Synechococcus sp. PCC 7335]|uniref:alpha-E domain-containing protein n=1 Tax=Synechococcus sp. (strain ATCC 29403 / PCC 7335) TaxID=91464 RepID=UPI00017EDCD1|nr:conserved domain protein [Synechococcus sp. PCC 7335]
MLSRVADSIYWLNRYIERAENVARFVEVNLNLLMDNPVGVTQQWEPLIAVTGDRALFQERYGQTTSTNVLNFLTFDIHSPNSIISCVRSARENARSVRETISSEMWEQINTFYLMVEDAAKNKPEDIREIYAFYAEVKLASHRFVGVMNATSSWNESWHFGRLGRLLERADKTSRILDVKYFLLLPSVKAVGSPLDNLQWISLLKSASAYEMYRKVEQELTPANVARFLIFNLQFPRSIKFCLRHAERSLESIIGPSSDISFSSQRELGKLRAEIEYVTFEEIFSHGLHEFLDGLQLRLNQVGDRVHEDFIAIPPSVQSSSITDAFNTSEQSQSLGQMSQTSSQGGQTASQTAGQTASQTASQLTANAVE